MEYYLKNDEQKEEVCNVVRFAINRSMFNREHLDYVISVVKALYDDRESISNMKIIWGHNLPMRRFHGFLEPYSNDNFNKEMKDDKDDYLKKKKQRD